MGRRAGGGVEIGCTTGQPQEAMPSSTHGSQALDQFGRQMFNDVGSDAVPQSTDHITSTTRHLQRIILFLLGLFHLTQLFLVAGGKLLPDHFTTDTDDDVAKIQRVETVAQMKCGLPLDDPRQAIGLPWPMCVMPDMIAGPLLLSLRQ